MDVFESMPDRGRWLVAVVLIVLVTVGCRTGTDEPPEAAREASDRGSQLDPAADDPASGSSHRFAEGTGDQSISDVQRELESPGPGRLPVDFELVAADAAEVRLELTANYWNQDPSDTIVLRRDGDVHATTLYLGEGQWLYRFKVDGVWTSDPARDVCVPAENGMCNSVVVVGSPIPETVAKPQAPTGEVLRLEVESDALDQTVPLLVHLPPGYDKAADYPLLVALHGYGQGATEWFDVVSLPTILDNLYHADAVEPMIVVAPEGHESFYQGSHADHIVDEVLPLVEQRWSVSADPARRAVTGWSMGGFGALSLAADHPDLFGFALPVGTGGYCMDVVCDDGWWDDRLSDVGRLSTSLFIGANDELGLTANHESIAAGLERRGLAYSSQILEMPGHVTDGHSIRFVRRVAALIVGEADAFFRGGWEPLGVVDTAHGCPGPYPVWSTSPYRLPFAVGEQYRVSLDNCSSSFHGSGSPDSHAYDFDMPTGTPVLAARGGSVTKAYDADGEGSGTPGGNWLTIDHGDGTSGVYLHFEQDSLTVSVGDEVEQGDVIGRSGASGTNAGFPHLHFTVVRSPAEWPYEGVPITFDGTEPNPRGLIAGRDWERLD